MDKLLSFFNVFLPKDPRKRDLAILAWIVVPLIVVSFAWAAFQGGYAEPIEPAVPLATPTIVSTPAN